MSVYFITARELNICKIGVAIDAKKRRSSLQTSCPARLTLEAVLPGSYKLERDLHIRFAEHRINGEWFKITPELDDLIAEAAASTVVDLPVTRAKPEPPVDDELVEKSIAVERQMLAEAMEDFDRTGCVVREHPSETRRLYEPVSVAGGQFSNRYAVRDCETRKTYCADFSLTWDQADRLCDVFSEIRQRALDLDLPRQRKAKAA